ncbi:peptide deformylase [Ignatzschineria cameli]|uniref:Peptide deformylase n=1 Tax=Ignatzschineria cameli TaxID=2182793 RepID=A0A2U2AKF0_9GAMM|nr:peptide deformylase [Ignatzschineria cameli]PWD83336.1 peptide deformylase [Ignatzschineria cameli]PWD85692.1 peptide deformylase [Ignatzschineria cameli]PWD88362.1 peptide deformylase [Ignatzschineria cameli]PWD88821.1 peptide deformylase [Ignatzschineria cameli]PWD89328.1 peptide deformylase [Ignatzschineria cameli]
MAILEVITVPHPTLREKAAPVTSFDATLKQLVEDMFETMYEEKGVGLAANQVNVLQRIFVADCSEERNDPKVFINPEILEVSEETDAAEEGCLSLPTLYSGPVIRPVAVRVRAQDVNGEFFELEADGLLGRCIQHEYDHLEGVLFIDYLSRLKQQRILKKLEKVLKERELE